MRIMENLSWQKLRNTVFVVNEVKQTIIKLEEVAADIWVLIAEGDDINTIANKIYEMYETDYEQAYIDITEYIDKLKKEGLIRA